MSTGRPKARYLGSAGLPAEVITTLLKEIKMHKLLSIVIAAMFATVSVSAFAASHAGAAKDDKKMEKKEAAMEKKGAAMEKKGAAMEKKGAAMEKKGAAMEKKGAAMEKKGAAMEKKEDMKK